MLLPRRESEAWEVGFYHDYDPALEEGVFGDAEMLLNGLNCWGDAQAICRQQQEEWGWKLAVISQNCKLGRWKWKNSLQCFEFRRRMDVVVAFKWSLQHLGSVAQSSFSYLQSFSYHSRRLAGDGCVSNSPTQPVFPTRENRLSGEGWR